MKKLYLTILTILVSAITFAQQSETVLQPSEIIAAYASLDPPSPFPPYHYKYLFEYDNNGTLAKYTMNLYDEPYVEETDTVVFLYNDINNIVRCNWEQYHPNQYPLHWMRKRYDYSYNNHRLEKVETHKYFDGPSPSQLTERWIPVYDDLGRLVSDTFYQRDYWLNYGDPTLKQTREYSYIESGKVTTIEQFYDNGTPKVKMRITETFSTDGKTLSVTWERYNYTSNIFVNKRQENRIYSDGRLSRVEVEYWSDNDHWAHDKRIVYTRDTNGRIVLTEYQLWDGNAYADYKRTVYELNEAGYPTTINFDDFSTEENDWIPGYNLCDLRWYDNLTDYYYVYLNRDIPNLARMIPIDTIYTQPHLAFINEHCFAEDGYGIQRLEISYAETPNPHYAVEEIDNIEAKIYPNPTNSIVNISGENIVNVEVVNIMGQVVMSKLCDTDETSIDISNLNSGVYLIKMITKDGKEFAERIVKE